MLRATLRHWTSTLTERRPDWRDLLALVLFALILYAPGIADRDLWDPDEPRYVEVAREMLLTGEYLVPHLNGEIYAHKPPLLFWLICLSARLFGGLGPAVARVPILASAIASLVVVYLLATHLLSRRHGLWAALVFATAGRIVWQGRTAQIDMLLVLLVAFAVLVWARCFGTGRERLSLWFYFVAGLATLAKGPVGLLVPLLAVIAFHSAADQRHDLRWLRLGPGLVLWAAVVLAWLAPAAVAGGQDYLQTIVLKQNVTRYAASWHHLRPWYYYLKTIPLEFLPWSMLLPVSAWVGLRRSNGRQREALLFALTWAVTTVVFFSLSPGKRSVYVLPMFPALALLVAIGVEQARQMWPRHRLGWIVSAGVLVPLWGVPLLAAALLPDLATRSPDLATRLAENAILGADFPLLLAYTLVPPLLAAIMATLAFARGRLEVGAATLAGGMVLFAWLGTSLLVPRLDLIKSGRPLAARLTEEVGPEDPIGVYPGIEPRYIYHTRRFMHPLRDPAQVREFVARPGRVWLLARKDELAKVQDRLPALVEVARDAEPEDGYVLLTNSAP